MKVQAELSFPERLKEEAVICSLCKKFDIIVRIVEASFSTDTGWAILVLEGKDHEVKKAFEHLKSEGVEVEDTQQLP